MRKTLAIAALLSGLLIPATSTTAVTTMWDPPQCQNAGLCDMQLEVDNAMCELVPPSEYQACRGEAIGAWATCRASC